MLLYTNFKIQGKKESMFNVNYKLMISTIVCVPVLSSSAIATTFSLSDVFNGISNAVSSPTSSEPPVLVKDMQNGPVLSSKPYLRGLASINYSSIPIRQNFNKDLEEHVSNHAATLLDYYQRYAQESRGLRVLLKDATGKIHLVRYKEDTKKVYSNPYSNNISVFDLSKLNDFGRSEYLSFYNYEIKTHIKIPEQYIKNGKVIFEDVRGPAIVYSRQGGPGRAYNSFAQICFQKIDGKFMTESKMTIPVSKENTIDYSISCYFGGYPTVPSLGIGEGNKDSLKDISEAQSVLPSFWNVYTIPGPLDKKEPEKYKITSKDIFLYEKEVQ